jgi:hypothetical protein
MINCLYSVGGFTLRWEIFTIRWEKSLTVQEREWHVLGYERNGEPYTFLNVKIKIENFNIYNLSADD